MRTFVAILAMLVVYVAPVRAEKSDPLTVDVELTRSAGDQSDTATATLVVADHGSSRAELVEAAAQLELAIAREGGEASAPTLRLELTRTTTVGKATQTERYGVVAKVALGKRVVLARLSHGDGSVTELAVTAR